MLEGIKRAAAPAVLRRISAVLRGTSAGPQTKDRLWRLAQRYATYHDVVTEAELVNGMRVRVSSAPRVEQELFLFGEWEPLFTRYLRSRDASDGIFLDVGANIGYVSLIASPLFAEVHAIEASPATCRRLRDNVRANGIDNIAVHEMAVGDREGSVDFFRDRRQSGGSSLIRTADHTLEARVPMAPLETILAGIDWARVRFIKIDVEGAEAPVLDSVFGLRDRLHREIELFVECDPERQDTWSRIVPFLAQGFSAFLMQGPYRRADYLEPERRTTLEPVREPPAAFCDLLLRRDPD